MDDSFGHWLAGLIDGEGSFVVVRVITRGGDPALRTWPNCRLHIRLRADDMEVLRTIRDTLKMGSLFIDTANTKAVNGSPAVNLSIHRLGDCVQVVELLKRYPLRSKKAIQFSIWADAVLEMSKGRERSDEVIEACRAGLTEAAKYHEPEGLANVRDGNPARLRHKLDTGVQPSCLCGCGTDCKRRTTKRGVPHPSNPFFSAYVLGHAKKGGRPKTI